MKRPLLSGQFCPYFFVVLNMEFVDYIWKTSHSATRQSPHMHCPMPQPRMILLGSCNTT